MKDQKGQQKTDERECNRLGRLMFLTHSIFPCFSINRFDICKAHKYRFVSIAVGLSLKSQKMCSIDLQRSKGECLTSKKHLETYSFG